MLSFIEHIYSLSSIAQCAELSFGSDQVYFELLILIESQY